MIIASYSPSWIHYLLSNRSCARGRHTSLSRKAAAKPGGAFSIALRRRHRGIDHWSAFWQYGVVFQLCTAIFCVENGGGFCVFCHVFFFICLPRIYLSFTIRRIFWLAQLDRIGIASLTHRRCRRWRGQLRRGWRSSPGSFYACMFLLTFRIATLFAEVRDIGQYFAEHFKNTLVIEKRPRRIGASAEPLYWSGRDCQNRWCLACFSPEANRRLRAVPTWLPAPPRLPECGRSDRPLHPLARAKCPVQWHKPMNRKAARRWRVCPRTSAGPIARLPERAASIQRIRLV